MSGHECQYDGTGGQRGHHNGDGSTQSKRGDGHEQGDTTCNLKPPVRRVRGVEDGPQAVERTCEQVRAGVESGFGKRSHTPQVIPAGPPIEVAALRTALDPFTCLLTARARTNFDRLTDSGLAEAGPDDAAREAALRNELRLARDTGPAVQ